MCIRDRCWGRPRSHRDRHARGTRRKRRRRSPCQIPLFSQNVTRRETERKQYTNTARLALALVSSVGLKTIHSCKENQPADLVNVTAIGDLSLIHISEPTRLLSISYA